MCLPESSPVLLLSLTEPNTYLRLPMEQIQRCSESESAENGEATHQDETVIDEDRNEEDGGEIQNTISEFEYSCH